MGEDEWTREPSSESKRHDIIPPAARPRRVFRGSVNMRFVQLTLNAFQFHFHFHLKMCSKKMPLLPRAEPRSVDGATHCQGFFIFEVVNGCIIHRTMQQRQAKLQSLSALSPCRDRKKRSLDA
ncbi:MAG: hypothetical protein P4L81_02640, partial [Candidatus Pacebacteria bacterium]|nr:hypothetical protein [Candidatus Paceibacterota bacterium]